MKSQSYERVLLSLSSLRSITYLHDSQWLTIYYNAPPLIRILLNIAVLHITILGMGLHLLLGDCRMIGKRIIGHVLLCCSVAHGRTI